MKQKIPPRQQSRPVSGKRPSVERLRRIERRKARSRAVALSVFVLAIMLVTILMIIAVMQQANPKPRLMFIQNGSITHSIQSTGLIIRDEMVFTSPADGLFKPLAAEGNRVAKGQKLALIIPSDKEDELKALQKCERDIVDLQTELMNSGKGAGAEAIFKESGTSLAAIVNLVRHDIVKGKMDSFGTYAATMGVILEQRTTRLMSIDFKDARLDELVQVQKSLESALGLAAGTLVCEKPGIVSFKLDGLETILNQHVAETIEAGNIGLYISQSDPASTENRPVSLDQPVLRISASLYQYLVFILEDTDPSLFKVDDLINIRIPDDSVTIENCLIIRSEASGRDTLIALKTDRKVEWLSDRRTVRAELTLSVTKGLKVPLSALMDLDTAAGGASLMIVKDGYTRACKVEVVDFDREYAIIRAIESEAYKPAVSTIIVANPQSIETGEAIGD